ncbi:hypothetical protein BDQ17DRAFT_58033 [Cyathus striatus]|nr:hypothetical protein BDQ17DRAFT_58033 [Cyathus striatus]
MFITFSKHDRNSRMEFRTKVFIRHKLKDALVYTTMMSYVASFRSSTFLVFRRRNIRHFFEKMYSLRSICYIFQFHTVSCSTRCRRLTVLGDTPKKQDNKVIISAKDISSLRALQNIWYPSRFIIILPIFCAQHTRGTGKTDLWHLIGHIPDIQSQPCNGNGVGYLIFPVREYLAQ